MYVFYLYLQESHTGTHWPCSVAIRVQMNLDATIVYVIVPLLIKENAEKEKS